MYAVKSRSVPFRLSGRKRAVLPPAAWRAAAQPLRAAGASGARIVMLRGGKFAHRRTTPTCLPPPDSRRRIVIAAPPRLLVGSGHFRPVGGMVGGGDDADPGCRRPPTCGGSGGGEFLTARRLRPARHLLRAVEASFRAAAPRAARRRGRCWRAFRCATMGAGLLPGRGASPPRPCSMGAAALLTPHAQDSHPAHLRRRSGPSAG